MKKSAIEELRAQKHLLKSEIEEMESNMPFKNASQTINLIGKGITQFIKPNYEPQQNSQNEPNSDLMNIATQLGLKFGTSVLVNKLIKSNLKSSSFKKRIIANVAAHALPFLLNKTIEIIESKKKQSKK